MSSADDLAEPTAPSRRAEPARWVGGSRSRRRRIGELMFGYTLLAPALILLVVFELFPLLYGLYISAVRLAAGCVEFIGLGNYVRGAERPGDVARAAGHGDLLADRGAGPARRSGLLLAYLLFQNVRGHELFRVLYFLPYITSTVASAAVWSYIYSPDNGLLNAGLRAVGLAGASAG